MNKVEQAVANRLSLRAPQREALVRLRMLCDRLALTKNIDLTVELAKVKELFPTCSDFERNFPSLCFALATGVGKTRLMGAFVVYLYRAKGIKNFFILAPNLTIYEKLKKDFSETNFEKYVFKGIGEFAQSPPKIITADEYNKINQDTIDQPVVNINIFNISKINAETRKGVEPKIKRLAEYLGDSYFNYLANLDDLVLLMDESHHYRADRGMQVLNELKPILGLELTATPQVERTGKAIKFKNVVYEYALANAIEDGFVKEPAIATRKDFDPSKYKSKDFELDQIKIEDGIHIHEDTKAALRTYALNNNVKPVKPFVLIVTKTTEHAGQIKKLIQSDTFFNGSYTDKVMEIHSNQKGSEKDENIDLLVKLESKDNNIEIVIHVNMLKEGWDVTNLYTIIPLRSAVSTTLREQTIGRGLRLPYGKRTRDKAVDTLTIVAHDKFQEIIDAANAPGSIIRQHNIIEIDPMEIARGTEVITAKAKWEMAFTTGSIVEREILRILPDLSAEVADVKEFLQPQGKEIFKRIYQTAFCNNQQQELFTEYKVEKACAVFDVMIKKFVQDAIEIPRISIQQKDSDDIGIDDFDLDKTQLAFFQPKSEDILIKDLREQEGGTRYIASNSDSQFIPESIPNILIAELLNFSEIDYSCDNILLFKLVNQALAHFVYIKTPRELYNVVISHKRDIVNVIYGQMMNHLRIETPQYENSKVFSFIKIEAHNFTKYKNEPKYLYTDTIEPTSEIPGKIFMGFKKACHEGYKFDSKTEKDFAIILEQDATVLKWLRPAERQFEILWDKREQRKYTPDFIVETDNTIYMIETKMRKDIDTYEVQAKSAAAQKYCAQATEFNLAHGKKTWRCSHPARCY
jgi:type III restriction enzyme